MGEKFNISNLNLYYGDFHALKDVDLSINEKEITADVINPGESVKVEVLEDAKPVVSVKITGTTKGGMKLYGSFTGLINNDTCFTVYLDEDMTLGMNSNIVNE